MRILMDAQEFSDVDVPAERVGPVPGEDREVGDRDMVAKNEGAVGEATVQDVHLALGLHRVAVDGVFDFHRRVLVEMREAAADVRGTSDLPEQPRKAIAAGGGTGRDEATELFREMEQKGAGLEDVHRLVAGEVDQRWDLGIGVDIDKPRSGPTPLSYL